MVVQLKMFVKENIRLAETVAGQWSLEVDFGWDEGYSEVGVFTKEELFDLIEILKGWSHEQD